MDADVLVIGGGIAGISAAARLAPHAKVVVVEQEATLAHHASGRSAAMFEPNYGKPAVVGLSRASAAYFQADPQFLLPRGLMFLGRADERALFAAEAAEMDLTEIGLEAARARVPILNPDTVAFVAVTEGGWDLDTDYLLQGFVRAVKAQGGEIRLKAPVSAIAKTPGGWRVTAGGQEITAATLLNAAGAWVDQVAALAGVAPLGFTPYRRSMARIPAPGGHDVSRWPMLHGVAEAWYAKPDAGALIVSPSEEHLMAPHDAFADDMVLAEGLARYEEMMTEPVTRLLANWAGLRTFAPDRVLVLGRDPSEPSFVWSAGQGGYGFQTAPAASQLVADAILGRAPELDPALVTQLSPARFR